MAKFKNMNQYFNQVKAATQRFKSQRKNESIQLLMDCNIPFSLANKDTHLKINTHEGIIDFWPELDQWSCTFSSKKGIGVHSLILTVRSIEATNIEETHDISTQNNN